MLLLLLLLRRRFGYSGEDGDSRRSVRVLVRLVLESVAVDVTEKRGKEVYRTEDKQHSEREKRELDERFPVGCGIQLQLQHRMVRPGSADSGRAREA